MCGATAENKKPNAPNVIPTMMAGINIPSASQPVNQPNIAATIEVPTTVMIDLVTAHNMSPIVISVIVMGVVNAVS